MTGAIRGGRPSDPLRSCWRLAAAVVVAGELTTATPAAAQAAAPGPPPRVAMTFRVEQRSERFRYHFDNESNFEPGPLVPHSIDQEYDSGNTWLFAGVSYRFLNAPAWTEAGITPRITTPGSDIDTFYQPSGDVITSGTRGEVRLRSLSIQQRFDLATWRTWTIGVSLAYRRSSMDYLPSDRIVTHTQPPSETREPVGGRETTWSHVVQSGFTASAPLRRGDRWTIGAAFEGYPIARARLNVSLPDKYPGEIIRADTFGFGAGARLTLERRSPRVTWGAGLKAARVWSYRETAAYRERQLGADLFIRVRWE